MIKAVLVIIIVLSYFLLRGSETTSLAGYSYPQLAEYFTKLAEQKGPRHAFDVLRSSKLRPNTDIHLLGHTISDVLYKKEGAAGMAICTNDFRNACSHAIVIGLYNDYGEAALEKISDACRRAPGGRGAYTMCFHGLGHGILAYYGYRMENALASCAKTGSLQYAHREMIECVGGAVMEIVGGGFHDRDIWQRQRVKYLSKKDPLAPCNKPVVPDAAKHMCYLYLTPNLIEPLAIEFATLTEQQVSKAFSACRQISLVEVANRDYCFGGVAKEFLVIVKARDFRNIEELTDADLDRWFWLCRLAESDDGIASCVRHSVNTFYWGGENNPRLSVRFCGRIHDVFSQNVCYSHLIGSVHTYAISSTMVSSACRLLPASYKKLCEERTL